MKKAVCVALILIAAGVVISLLAMILMGFDFRTLNRAEAVTNTHTVEETFSSVSVESTTVDVKILPSEDGRCTVVCKELENLYHTVTVEDGRLIIREHDDRKWHQHIGILWYETEVLVYLPEGIYDEILANVTTGDIEISAVDCREIRAETTTGDICISNVTLQDVHTECTTGDIRLNAINATTLTAKCTTGDIHLSNVITSGKIGIETTTGDIGLHRCDAATLTLKATTGDVTGSLRTPKIFYADTSTGDVKVPHSTEGGACTVNTTTGDIELWIE